MQKTKAVHLLDCIWACEPWGCVCWLSALGLKQSIWENEGKKKTSLLREKIKPNLREKQALNLMVWKEFSVCILVSSKSVTLPTDFPVSAEKSVSLFYWYLKG